MQLSSLFLTKTQTHTPTIPVTAHTPKLWTDSDCILSSSGWSHFSFCLSLSASISLLQSVFLHEETLQNMDEQRLKNVDEWLSPNRSSKGRGPYISQSFSFSDSLLSVFISLPVCPLLPVFVSHPLSGLTPDEFVLQALSLRLFKLHKKISSYWRGVWRP